MSETNAQREDTGYLLSRARYVLEETLRLSEAHGIGHNEIISVTQLTHMLITKSLDIDAVEGEPRFPLCELVANEVAAYEKRTGEKVPENLLEDYGWSMHDLDDMVAEYRKKPMLRIVPAYEEDMPQPEADCEEPLERKSSAKKKPAKSDYLPHPDDEIANYLRDINAPGVPKYHKMSSEEQQKLVAHMIAGDMEAARTMVLANLGLVISHARKYAGRGLSLMELITYGNDGLMNAASPKYDPSRSKFSTYASWWIKQSIRRGILNEQKTVRIPAYMVEAITKFRRFKREFITTYGIAPTAEDVAAKFEVDIPQAKQIMSANIQAEGNSKNKKELPFLGDIPAANENGEIQESEELSKAMSAIGGLSEREQTIIKLRYGLDGLDALTLEHVGGRIHLTRERVRQIQALAEKKLQCACGVITQEEFTAYIESKRHVKGKRKKRR